MTFVVCVCVCVYCMCVLGEGVVVFILAQLLCHKWRKPSCGNHQPVSEQAHSSMRTGGTSLEDSAETWCHVWQPKKEGLGQRLCSLFLPEGAILRHRTFWRWSWELRVEFPKGGAVRLKRCPVFLHGRSINIWRTKESVTWWKFLVPDVTSVWNFFKSPLKVFWIFNFLEFTRWPDRFWISSRHVTSSLMQQLTQIFTRSYIRYS